MHETAALLAEFLATWRPTLAGPVASCEDEIFLHFYSRLRTYGADRLLLALTLAGQAMGGADPAAGAASIRRLGQVPALREAVRPALIAAIAQDRTSVDLAWQQEQTNHWWQESQTLAADIRQRELDLARQQEQTEHWWQERQTLVADLRRPLHRASQSQSPRPVPRNHQPFP